jgi:hypothetical protein
MYQLHQVVNVQQLHNNQQLILDCLVQFDLQVQDEQHRRQLKLLRWIE